MDEDLDQEEEHDIVFDRESVPEMEAFAYLLVIMYHVDQKQYDQVNKGY